MTSGCASAPEYTPTASAAVALGYRPSMTFGDQLHGVEIAFFIDWYDGPLSGVARHLGTEYWFEAEGRQDETYAITMEDRRFVLYPITAEELAEEADWQRLYDEHVQGKPESEKWKFYEPYENRRPPDYASRQPVGWFIAK